jgi:hypothetical protein
MAHQAQMTHRNGPARDGRDSPADPTAPGRAPASTASEPGATAVVSGIAGFGENLLNLAELQTRLAAIELRQHVQAMKGYAGAFMCGGILSLASVVMALIGVAELCVSELGIKRGVAYLAVAAGGILLAAGCAAVGIATLRQKPVSFPLSSEELARNLQWIRTVVRQSGRGPQRR